MGRISSATYSEMQSQALTCQAISMMGDYESLDMDGEEKWNWLQ